ncbi:MAG: TOBE domain-containing protein [Helicobacteraceae bacterium]
MQLSARNILVARVAGLTKSDVNTLVELDLGGVRLTSTITTSAALGLDLKPGDEVKAIFKSSSVMVSTAKDLAISARNIIEGKIVQLTIGDVNAEVVLELSPKDRVVSVITSNSAKALGLETGKTCFAVIKSSEIMIGK